MTVSYVPPWICLRCGVPLARPNHLCSAHTTAQLRVKP
jgi:hypothetical protein